MRTDPCNTCQSFDWYERGDFVYCRPCHSEAQKRYMQRKAMGDSLELLKPPSIPLYEQNLSRKLKPIACKQGHLLSGDNLRPSSQRNGRHNRSRCRACERNAKRVKYGLSPETAPNKLSEMFDSQADS
jgi:hypothetical protein